MIERERGREDERVRGMKRDGSRRKAGERVEREIYI